MDFLSKLLLKMACALSPQYVKTYLQHTQSQNHIQKNQLDKLSMLLSTLLSSEPSTMKNMDAIVELDKEITEKKLEAEKYNASFFQQKLLPHRTYGVALSNDGVSWIASLRLADDTTLVGRGKCPQEALIDFDMQWLGSK